MEALLKMAVSCFGTHKPKRVGSSKRQRGKKAIGETKSPLIPASSLGSSRINPLAEEVSLSFGSDKSIPVIPSFKLQVPADTGPLRIRGSALPASQTDQCKVSPTHSGSVGSSEVGSPEILYELDNPKESESESPRYQALLRMINAPRKRFSGDIKSFSHELNSKGVLTFPSWESKKISTLIRNKFDKAKEEVNSDLTVFGEDLLDLPNEYKESHPELVVAIEDLLVLAKRCVNTASGDFWLQCEGIVQELDDRRKELPQGVLKQLHTRMLFILTRCTRLLQFHKERSSVLSTKKAYSQRFDVCPDPLSSPYNDTSKDPESSANIYRLFFWKILSSVTSNGVKEAASSSKERNGCKVERLKVVRHRIAESERINKLSWGYWGNESFISEVNSIICRICEMEVPTTNVKDHSKICALADKYNKKCESVDEVLVAIAATLEKVTKTLIQKNSLAVVESSEEYDDLSPKLIELLSRGKGTFHDQGDIQKMSDIADIARCAAKAIQVDNQSACFLTRCIEALRNVILSRKFDALIVDTFGTRIEKLITIKFIQLVKLLTYPKFDLSRTIIDENAPLEDGVVRSLRTSLVHPRTSIDHFELIKSISSGAFGRVVLARKKTTGDLFAIKILRKADMIRKNAVKSILAERDILSNVHNPFVVRFFYSFTCSVNLYLVMEYVNGGDLYSLLKQLECMDENLACGYIAELVLALEYLHSEGIVHRDLKPDNLLIAHDGHLKLTDFGLSKVGLIDSTNDLAGPTLPTQEHKPSALGTPDYLAPEILLGTGHGATADWWSLGVILYELLVGMPPFSAEQPQQIFDNILNRNIQWPEIPDEMTHEAYDLIDRLLTEDPRQRLGAKGAAEVKQHIFFKGINWDTLAQQKAIFVPDSNNPLDTSYFMSRYNSDEQRSLNGQGVDIPSGSSRFDTSVSENDSFINFSFKNHSELAYINNDLCQRVKEMNPNKVCMED